MIEELLTKEKKIPYSFRPNQPPLSIWNPMSGVEKSFFCSAAKHSLKFFRVQTKWGQRVYKLGNDHSFADFVLKDGGVKLLKLQGDEDFLINKITKVLFECGAKRIAGTTEDDVARFARCGFATNPEKKTFALLAPQTLSEGS